MLLICPRAQIQSPDRREEIMSATIGDSAYGWTLTGQCSGAFSGTDLGSGMVVSGCCTANIVVYGMIPIPDGECEW